MSEETVDGTAPTEAVGEVPGASPDAPAGAVAPLRQTVSANGASCDVRVGDGVLERFGRDLRVCCGRTGTAALLVEGGADPDLVESLRRLVTDAGFLVRRLPDVPGAGAADASRLPGLWEALGAAGVTSSDALVAVGGRRTLSLASFAASTWCGGTPLACVPLSLDALVLCPALPLPLASGGEAAMVSARCRMAMCYAEPGTLDIAAPTPGNLAGRAAMVAAAVCESRDAFNTFVMRSEAMAAGDVAEIARQALEAARGVGRVSASTSVAVRRSLSYGETFARALGRFLPEVGWGPRLGEGLRFAARLAVGAVEGDIDFVFAQDALLDRLSVTEVACTLDPAALGRAFREEELARTNRAMVALPHAVGRVRMAAVDDAVLEEHLAAWCAARSVL